MKPTQEQVIAWAREAGFSKDWQGTWHCIFAQMNEAFTLAYKAGAAATLKNSVMTDEEYEQAMADESQRTRLTFDAEVIEMVKEAVEMEREACAGVLDAMAEKDKLSNYYQVAALAIRARGQG